jgi:hypothetical protein
MLTTFFSGSPREFSFVSLIKCSAFLAWISVFILFGFFFSWVYSGSGNAALESDLQLGLSADGSTIELHPRSGVHLFVSFEVALVSV